MAKLKACRACDERAIGNPIAAMAVMATTGAINEGLETMNAARGRHLAAFLDRMEHPEAAAILRLRAEALEARTE